MALPYLSQFMRRRSSLPVFKAETVKTDSGKPIYHHTWNSSPAGGVIGSGSEDFIEILTVDPIDLSQSLNFSDIVEVGDQLLNARSVFNYAERSDNSFEVMMKLDGTNGSKPAEHFLFERLFGTSEKFDTTPGGLGQYTSPYTGLTTNALRYTFKYAGDTFQIAQIVDNYMMKVANGSYISGGSMEVSREGALSATINTRSSKISYAGTSNVENTNATNGALANDELDVANGEYTLFTKCLFYVMDDEGNIYNNAGAFIPPPKGDPAITGVPFNPYEVTGINGNVITAQMADGTPADFSNILLPAGGQSAVCVIPIVQTYNDDTSANRVQATFGEVVPQGTASIFLGDKDITLTTLLQKSNGVDFDNQFLGSQFTFNVEKNLGDPGVQELTGDPYPAPVYVAQDISVTGSMSMVLRPKEVYRLNRALDEYEQSLAVVIDPKTSTLAGRHIIIFMPRVRLSFSSTEVEGAEGASIDWFLTRPSTAKSDKDVFEMYIV
jgi:hypothetical protein